MRSLFFALAVVSCGGPPTKVQATIAGDTGNKMGLPVCIEISYQNKKSLGSYTNNLCSDAAVPKVFSVTLSGQADNISTDVYSSSGKVFLRAGKDELAGMDTSRSEETKSDTVNISVAVKF